MKNEELKDRFIDKKTGIEYTLIGDYYIPNLALEPQIKINLNKYGILRLEYLKNFKRSEYSILSMDNKLTEHLKNIQENALRLEKEIIKSLKERSNLTEKIKDTDQLYWVGTMNALKKQREKNKKRRIKPK